MPSFYRIGELTGEFGVTPRTLRFYEEKGLLAPERRGNVRLYAEVEREKLAQIVQLTRFGLPSQRSSYYCGWIQMAWPWWIGCQNVRRI